MYIFSRRLENYRGCDTIVLVKFVEFPTSVEQNHPKPKTVEKLKNDTQKIDLPLPLISTP
jgi:hypothetical protein